MRRWPSPFSAGRRNRDGDFRACSIVEGWGFVPRCGCPINEILSAALCLRASLEVSMNKAFLESKRWRGFSSRSQIQPARELNRYIAG